MLRPAVVAAASAGGGGGRGGRRSGGHTVTGSAASEEQPGGARAGGGRGGESVDGRGGWGREVWRGNVSCDSSSQAEAAAPRGGGPPRHTHRGCASVFHTTSPSVARHPSLPPHPLPRAPRPAPHATRDARDRHRSAMDFLPRGAGRWSRQPPASATDHAFPPPAATTGPCVPRP
ncbi:hypothetical protein I4F81_010340 [Pyropia yezoensis]|uniref:Uncharacterized protein n=1 Tax=Pyropia yezoensis TaxID=2788 RepID=A0ACC3CCD1_PYRYE|nr:hypothetical protein I4F81_010340 [Neopyropia yezoensis]